MIRAVRSVFVAGFVAAAMSACSGGGGGGGSPGIEIVPPAAEVVPFSEGNDRVTFSALVDGEPADVQWSVVGGGYVDVTNGPSTTYYAPPDGILTEPIAVTLLAFADGGEGEAAITLRDSAGLLNIQYDNYDVPEDFGIGALGFELVDSDTNETYDFLFGTLLGYPLQAGTYHATDAAFTPQYMLWGGIGVEGEYSLIPASVVVPDDDTVTLHIRWADSGTGFLWAATNTSGLLGFDGPSLVPGISGGQARFASSIGTDRVLVDVVDTDDLLWAADNAESSLVGFGASSLGTGNNLTASLMVFDTTLLVGNTASIAAPIGVAFDVLTGDLYYANAGNDTFGRFSANQLDGAGGAVEPDAFFGNLTRTGVSAIAIDPVTGNVWLADADSATVQRFDLGDLGASGTPLPAAVLSGPWTGPVALTFDSAGSLWIGDTAAAIYRLDATLLATTGVASIANADLTVTGAVIGGNIHGIVFDDAGDMWIADGTNGEIDRILGSAIGGTGTATIDTTFTTLDAPNARGLAFRRRPPAP